MESLEDRLTPAVAFFPGVNSPISVDSGSNPNAVAVADFNNDGNQDVAATIRGTNRLAIFLGAGNGGFSGPAYTDPLVSGTAPNDVVAGDVNGDGIPDLVTANSTSTNVSVLIGNGNGTFQTSVEYTVGTLPLSVKLADFDGDGFKDIVVANQQTNNVSVLKNNGDGTFGAKTDYNVGTSPFALATGDLNGDGFQDVAVANSATGNVTLLLGRGDGTFTLGNTLTVGTNPQSIVAADFNNDGKTDLATLNVASGTSSTVSVLLSTGSGNFAPANTFSYTGNTAAQITAADFTGDGVLDLTITNTGGQNVGILQGTGSGTFTLPGSAIGVGSQSPIGIAIGDFNNDGKADFVTANSANNTIYAAVGYSPDATLTSHPTVLAPATTYTFTVTYTGLVNSSINAPINTSTLGNNNILVTGPNGFSQLATFVSFTTSGASRIATYTITPPGGIWSFNSNGTYNIAVQPNQVADTNGVFVHMGTIGNFVVSVGNEFNNVGVGYVEGLYQSILGRVGDTAGLKYWNDLLNSGAAKDTIFTGFWVSVEHRTLQVRSYYEQYLGREADSASLKFYVAKFAQGAKEADVISAIMNSNEYKNINGGTANGVIGAIYNDLLGRTPSAAEIQIWANAFAVSGSGAVARGVMNSVEYQLDLAKQDYIDFLNRPLTSQSEIDSFTYTARKSGPYGEQQIAQSFAVSSEFINLTLTTIQT